MALNIQSGATWAEIRAEINDKAFDKNGDSLFGSITDINGNEALKIDVDNQKVYSYGVNGESHCGRLLGVNSGDYTLVIPSGMKRGICTIETADTTTSNADFIDALLHFSTDPEQSKLIGWVGHLSFKSYTRLAQNNSSYANAYIDGNELRIHISSMACSSSILNIYWEVW